MRNTHIYVQTIMGRIMGRVCNPVLSEYQLSKSPLNSHLEIDDLTLNLRSL